MINFRLQVHFSYGIIIRSSAANADINTVLNEAYSLIDQYEHIIQNAVFGTFYTKLYEKEPPMVSELRHLSADNTIEVITDIPYYYDLLNTHFKDNSNMSLRLYEDELLLYISFILSKRHYQKHYPEKYGLNAEATL